MRPSRVGQGLGEAHRPAVVDEAVERHVDAGGRHARLGVEHVGRDGRDRVIRALRHAILRGWERCRSTSVTSTLAPAGSPARRRPIEAIRHMLPIESKLIHCRWTGESTWIPFGDFRPGLDYENHTSHPAPGQLAIYPGGISECEIFFPYGGCTTASKVGQLAANHFATVVADDGWEDRLREIGRRCLWEGAQSISIREVE